MRGANQPNISNDVNSLNRVLDSVDQRLSKLESEAEAFGLRVRAVEASPKLNELDPDKTPDKSIYSRRATQLAEMKAELRYAERILSDIIKKLDQYDIQAVPKAQVKPKVGNAAGSRRPPNKSVHDRNVKVSPNVANGSVKVGLRKEVLRQQSTARMQQSGRASSGDRGNPAGPTFMVDTQQHSGVRDSSAISGLQQF